jgi:hypothetical protein
MGFADQCSFEIASIKIWLSDPPPDREVDCAMEKAARACAADAAST